MAKWSERLHPRDVRGRFSGRGGGSAARAARREGNRVAPGRAGARRRGYALAGVKLTGGLASGAASAAVGRATGSRRRVAYGAGRAGLAVASARHDLRTTRRKTSRAFSALNAREQGDEMARARTVGRRYTIASAGADVGSGAIVGQRLAQVRRANVRGVAARPVRRISGGPRLARRSRRGVYDVTSSPVRKPRSAGRRRAAGYASEFKRRTGRSARARSRWARRNRKSRGIAIGSGRPARRQGPTRRRRR